MRYVLGDAPIPLGTRKGKPPIRAEDLITRSTWWLWVKKIQVHVCSPGVSTEERVYRVEGLSTKISNVNLFMY